MLKLLPYIRFSYLFLIFGALFGLLYALQMVGLFLELLRPDIPRSLHISLMLYGFAPLMLSLLPFALFEKEGLDLAPGMPWLQRYFLLWFVFLLFMSLALLAGVSRGLPFYDFPYELNVLLAVSGIFYLVSILKIIKGYEVKPLWVKVSLAVVSIAPFALLLLMNPDYGQVEKMLLGPHGDNTLGMSFAMLVIYYLVIKLHAPSSFKPRRHILWIVPLGFYALSVLYRSFVGSISYEAEWFLQYLTLLYLPLLWTWWRDAKLNVRDHLALFISIAAFVFADVEGNILFIPEIREIFHRKDLVVGHAHIAVALAMLFMAFAVIEPIVKFSKKLLLFLTGAIMLMAFVLTLSGFSQAGFGTVDTFTMWEWRAFAGFLFFAGLFAFYNYMASLKQATPLQLYHLAAFMSDGIGGIVLLCFGSYLYGFIGQPFTPGYQNIVFGFVTAVGSMHLMAYLIPRYGHAVGWATSMARIVTAAGFFALYKAEVLGWIAPAIAAADLAFALTYLLYFQYSKESSDESPLR
jgi:hypothetical protein